MDAATKTGLDASKIGSKSSSKNRGSNRRFD